MIAAGPGYQAPSATAGIGSLSLKDHEGALTAVGEGSEPAQLSRQATGRPSELRKDLAKASGAHAQKALQGFAEGDEDDSDASGEEDDEDAFVPMALPAVSARAAPSKRRGSLTRVGTGMPKELEPAGKSTLRRGFNVRSYDPFRQ